MSEQKEIPDAGYTAYAVTQQVDRGTLDVLLVSIDPDSAERFRDAAKESWPDGAYRVEPVPFVGVLPPARPLYQWNAAIPPTGEIVYDEETRSGGPYATGWPGLNGFPAEREIAVETVGGGAAGTRYLLARGWDRDATLARLQEAAQRAQAEFAREAATPWACPGCYGLEVEVVYLPRKVVSGMDETVSLMPPRDDPFRLRCTRCRRVYPVPDGLEIGGV